MCHSEENTTQAVLLTGIFVYHRLAIAVVAMPTLSHSHQIPVQAFLFYVKHEVHDAPFEKDFKTQVVFKHH